MNCRSFQRNLEDYLEGGLDFAGRFGMERHARQCYSCGRQSAVAQKLSQLAREQERIRTPQNFEAAVMERIHGRDSLSWFERVRVYGLDFSSARPYALWATSMLVLAMGIYVVADRYSTPHSDGSVVARQTDPPVAVLTEPAQAEPVSVSAESMTPSLDLQPADASSGRFDRVRRQAPLQYVAEPSEYDGSDYLQYTVPGPDGRLFIMRLPKTIRMRYGQPSEEYFIRNVSH